LGQRLARIDPGLLLPTLLLLHSLLQVLSAEERRGCHVHVGEVLLLPPPPLLLFMLLSRLLKLVGVMIWIFFTLIVVKQSVIMVLRLWGALSWQVALIVVRATVVASSSSPSKHRPLKQPRVMSLRLGGVADKICCGGGCQALLTESIQLSRRVISVFSQRLLGLRNRQRI
jgi:hypothetical protein